MEVRLPMANRIVANFRASVKLFYRSPSNIFWTVAFPVLLILIFGALFTGGQSSGFTVYVQDHSHSGPSEAFVRSLNQTGMFNLPGQANGSGIIMVNDTIDPGQFIKDHSAYIFVIIPANYSEAFMPNASRNAATIEIRSDPTSGSATVVRGIVAGVIDYTNLGIAGGKPVINFASNDISGFKYIDFFLPGVIGLTVMTTTVNWSVGMMTRYRENGIFKKLATTPLTRYEWLTTQILWQLVVVFISVSVIILVGLGLYRMTLTLDALAIVTIILASAMFSSIGMIIARFIKNEETAAAAAGAITFPMMFLAGSFFPLETMPSFLRAISQVLPLTYVNQALRDSMIYGNIAGATLNLLIVAVLAVVFFVIGVIVSTWKTE